MRLAGTWINERDLLMSVMRNLQGPAGNTYGLPRWSVAADVFCLGSNSAAALCREFGFDPDEQLIHPDALDADEEELDE